MTRDRAVRRYGGRAVQGLTLVGLLTALPPGRPTALLAQSWNTITSARQLHGERAMTIHVAYGAGRFQLTPGIADELYRMVMRYDEDKFIPVREFDAAGSSLRLGLRSREGSGLRVNLGDQGRKGPPPSLNLALSPALPLSLDLQLGAVESDVELGGLALRHVHYETGASATHLHFSSPNTEDCDELSMEAGAAQLTAQGLANSNCARITFRGGVGEVNLDFGGTWQRSIAATVEVGIGSLNLQLPRDVGVSVHLNRFLASFDAAGFQKRGSTYYSANYNDARYRLTMDVNASLGGIDVAWVP